jgi:hypothetical protein
MTHQTMTCEQFDELLPDYLPDADGAVVLDAPTRAAATAHLDRCDRCAALTADLAEITRQAAVLAPLRPERDLWAGIAERIAAPVVALPGLTGETPAPGMHLHATTRDRVQRATHTFSRRWLGAAAAALVAVTAGVTYTATRAGDVGQATQVAVADPAIAPHVAPSPSVPAQVATAPEPEAVAASGPAREPTTGRRPRGAAPANADPAGRLASDPQLSAVAPAAATYDREIAALRRIVQQRRAELDPTTVAVLERNMRLIDDAIAQSRAALARDPRSGFLGQQLERALDQKLDLLRTVALLPRT